MKIRVDAERRWKSLMDLARIGATPKGGVRRIALSAADREGRDQFVRWARDAALAVRWDAIGNIFARRPGSDASAGAVLMGSHLDSQPSGGKFDGAYGVMAGLEVMRALNERGVRTRAPLELVSWTNEEGSRFVPTLMGSGVFARVFPLESILSATDVDGAAQGRAHRREPAGARGEPHRHLLPGLRARHGGPPAGAAQLAQRRPRRGAHDGRLQERRRRHAQPHVRGPRQDGAGDRGA